MNSQADIVGREIEWCKAEIERMLHLSQTKVIFPLITLGLLQEYLRSGQAIFSDSEIKKTVP
jgi:hypothetical protein